MTMATVETINGQLVLNDADALAVIKAVERFNGLNLCKSIFDGAQERIEHFKSRAKIRGLSSDAIVIIIASVDDPHGGPLTEQLMPGNESLWNEIRAKGESPYSRGLATRQGIQSYLELFEPDAAAKLMNHAATAEPLVVVIAGGTADIYPSDPI